MTPIEEGMAQKVMDEFYFTFANERQDFIVQKLNNDAVANALREVVNLLKYQSFHHTEEYYLLSADDILELCNEIEKRGK